MDCTNGRLNEEDLLRWRKGNTGASIIRHNRRRGIPIVLFVLCQAVWSGSVTRQCDLAVWPGSVIGQCDQAVWPGSVTRQCDQAVWSGSVIRQCDQAVWSGSVIRQCDQAVWSGSVTRQRDQAVWPDVRAYESAFVGGALRSYVGMQFGAVPQFGKCVIVWLWWLQNKGLSGIRTRTDNNPSPAT